MAVNIHATHFRFGIDELTEATHDWYAAQDVNPSLGVVPLDTVFLLRFTVQETGGTAAGNHDNQFQFRINGGTWTNLTTTSVGPRAAAAAAFTNGQDCTKRLTGTGTFESSGDGCTEDGLSGGAQNDIAASGNSETECGIVIDSADVAGGDVIEFQLISPDRTVTNDVVPSLTIQAATIVEADGVVVGIGATVVLGVAIWLGLSAATGTCTLDGDGAPVVVGLASALGGAEESVNTSATAGSIADSTGLTTALGTATNTEAADGGAAATASDVVLGVALWNSVHNSTAAGVVTGFTASVWLAVAASTIGGGVVASPVIIND